MLGIEIKHKIDNFSGLIPIEEFWKKCPTKIIGCYFLYNNNKELIYIGKSIATIRQRVNYHCFQIPSPYLTECELERLIYMRKKTKYFSYTTAPKDSCDFLEVGLINKLKPQLNIKHKL